MIMKLDHISYIASRSEADVIHRRFTNHTLLFQEINKKNPVIKCCLMHEEQMYHDLFYYIESIPVEIILYDKVYAGSQICVEMEQKTIYAKTSNLSMCLKFLRMVGFQEIISNDLCVKCNLRGAFDKKDYWLVLEQTPDLEPVYLDNRGYGCITLLVDNITRLRDTMCVDESKGIFTESETVVVNSRRLEVSFLRLDILNIIFELITPKRI